MWYGYIVIVLEYIDFDIGKYEYSSWLYRIVIVVICDVCKWFGVDLDCVFFFGYGMGGDVVFDIGMLYFEIFVGVILIVGCVNCYCRITVRNISGVVWYVVGGELDYRVHDVNFVLLNWMMNEWYDVVYVEYIGCGKEFFYEEIHWLFEWMYYWWRRLLVEVCEIVVRV